MATNFKEKFTQTMNKPTADALPFKLCMPLHGVLIGLEWAVADCFFAFNNRVFFAIVIAIFLLHITFLCIARTKYCKANSIKINYGKTILHVLGIIAYIAIAMFLMESFFLG